MEFHHRLKLSHHFLVPSFPVVKEVIHHHFNPIFKTLNHFLKTYKIMAPHPIVVVIVILDYEAFQKPPHKVINLIH